MCFVSIHRISGSIPKTVINIRKEINRIFLWTDNTSSKNGTWTNTKNIILHFNHCYKSSQNHEEYHHSGECSCVISHAFLITLFFKSFPPLLNNICNINLASDWILLKFCIIVPTYSQNWHILCFKFMCTDGNICMVARSYLFWGKSRHWLDV